MLNSFDRLSAYLLEFHNQMNYNSEIISKNVPYFDS